MLLYTIHVSSQTMDPREQQIVKKHLNLYIARCNYSRMQQSLMSIFFLKTMKNILRLHKFSRDGSSPRNEPGSSHFEGLVT